MKAQQVQAPVTAQDFEVSPVVEQMMADFASANGNAAPDEKARIVATLCRALKLNPLTSPIQWIRLSGRDTLYVTKVATDQLAAMYGLHRDTIEGPLVVDVAGTKVVLCKVRATLPGGRSEVATATLPLQDPVNVLMKCETKAKRRATLSILGLGLLAEEELETIPESAKGHPRPAAVRALSPIPETAQESPARWIDEITVTHGEPEPPADPSPTLRGFLAMVPEVELPGEAAVLWIKVRAEFAALPGDERETAWKALGRRVAVLQKVDEKAGRIWLKRAIADEDARPVPPPLPTQPDPEEPPPAGSPSPKGRRSKASASGSASATSTPSGATQARRTRWDEETLARDPRAWRAYLEGLARTPPDDGAAHVAGSYWKRAEGFREVGTHAECLAATLDELSTRGVTEGHSWLQEIGQRNGYARRAA